LQLAIIGHITWWKRTLVVVVVVGVVVFLHILSRLPDPLRKLKVMETKKQKKHL
jgi:predicted MFS family arabinose efflux permease